MAVNIMSFIMINIYILIPINVILVICIFYLVIKNKLYSNRYSRLYNSMKPIVMNYINNESPCMELIKFKGKFKYELIMDIMLDYTLENNASISGKFEELGYVDYLIEKGKKKFTLKIIKKLGLIKSPRAYSMLHYGTRSYNFEMKYMSYYALSLIKLEGEKVKKLINRMLSSEITRDRQIEIITNHNIGIEECLDLLDEQTSDRGKVILIRVLNNNSRALNEVHTDRLIKYLDEHKEVKIAAILALASSKNRKYLNKLVEVYRKEEIWEVRAAIAKALVNFPEEEIIEPLKVMVYDEEWWVRFNAVEVLARLGDRGVDILVDLSLDLDNAKVSNLAYYMLNSNKHIYNTVQSA